MINVIVGKKGSGKTKKLIDMANNSVISSNGNVVVIEKGNKLTYHINHGAKLIDTDQYGINGYGELFGLICGMCGENYDITDIYLDSTLKIGGDNLGEFEQFMGRCSKALNDLNVKLTVLVSASESDLSDSFKSTVKFL